MRFLLLAVLFGLIMFTAGVLPEWLMGRMPTSWPVELQLGCSFAPVLGLVALLAALDGTRWQRVLVRKRDK